LLSLLSCQTRDRASSAKQDFGKTENGIPLFYEAGNRFHRWEGEDRYLGEVQTVFAKRCVSCHACSDSPCSAKLTSYEGFARGASKTNFYAVRAGEVKYPSSAIDADGFHKLTNASFNNSMMFQFLKLGKNNTTEADTQGSFSPTLLTGLEKQHAAATYTCPATLDEFNAFAKAYPQAGMPLGLPRLSDSENQAIMSWLAESGKGPSPEASLVLERPSRQDVVFKWDRFLNDGADNLRRKLVARYIYEHLFDAHVSFEEMPGEFFKLVRSHSVGALGNENEFQHIDAIETALPTDDPNKPNRQVFYRFKKITEVIAQKNHVVFRLNLGMINSWDKLFFKSDVKWQVISLPDYSIADPFQNFKQIPPTIRHRFMLENARYIVDSMVRAPVCKGESATFAIADHFWVYFLRPESDPSSGAKIPMSEEGFKGLDLTEAAWTNTGAIEDRFVRNFTYINAFEDALRANLAASGKKGLEISDIWKGEALRDGGKSSDRNAWLSITRHDTNTTVQYGMEGGTPQSMWVLTYANFERLYYNLVVNFKYWGSLEHKLGTWRSMSHERMEGEDLFISMLPESYRTRIRDEWSGGLVMSGEMSKIIDILKPVVEFKTGIDLGDQTITRYIDLYPLQASKGGGRKTGVAFKENVRADIELSRMLRDEFVKSGVTNGKDDLNSNFGDEPIQFQPWVKPVAVPNFSSNTIEEFEKTLAAVLAGRGRGSYAPYIPASTVLRIDNEQGERFYYTFVGNRGYKSHNIAMLSSSETSSPVRDSSRDTISVYRGVVGDYPQIFLHAVVGPNAKTRRADELLKLVSQMDGKNYRGFFDQIKAKYSIQKNRSEFWPFVDQIHSDILTQSTDVGAGLTYGGILDLSKYYKF